MLMSREEKRRIAKERGVCVKTVERWVREGGSEAVGSRRRMSASEAGRLGGKKSLWGETRWK